MAKAGEGKHEIIISNDTMEEKGNLLSIILSPPINPIRSPISYFPLFSVQTVLRQLDRALKPALTDLTVDWGTAANINQTPYHLSPLFGGGRFIVYGFFPEGAELKDEQVGYSSSNSIHSSHL